MPLSLPLMSVLAAVATAPTTLVYRINHQFRAPSDPVTAVCGYNLWLF
jgi:hypothetical protein